MQHEILFDFNVPLVADARFGHNRWHPDIAPIASIRPGEEVALTLRDGHDGQITADTSASDIVSLDLLRSHPLTGPLWIDGAEPGDLLVVETLNIEPDVFGATVVIPGVGFLRDYFPEPYLVRWHIDAGIARSDDLPGVAIRGRPFLGVMGVAPSHRRLARFSAREEKLSQSGAVVPLPHPTSAVPSEIGARGLRTVPPRETGGNLDIRQLTVGSRLILPVDVRGALFSAGDLHFAQGEGETCVTAIEIHGEALLRFDLRKHAARRWRPTYPAYEFVEGPATAERRFFATTGFPIDAHGENRDMDLNLAAEVALKEMLTYLREVRGFSDYQSYVLISVAVDLRISQIVDAPNACVSALLPLDIFETRADHPTSAVT